MLLSMQGISKAFAGVPALKSASLEVEPAEVMALVGQNGAGKSTLIKILTGVYRRDEGSIAFDDRDVDFSMPAEAQAIATDSVFLAPSTMASMTSLQWMSLRVLARSIATAAWRCALPAARSTT